MSITGAEIVMDALVQEKVEVFFGYPGGAVLDIFDVIERPGMPRFILTRHEQGAGHMADGYARATGRVGVCLATSGPGATNLATAIATANSDSIPMVAITGQVGTAAIGNDAFQEVDVVGFTRCLSKHNYLVRTVEELPRILKEAFHIARTGRPGAVVVDIPKDVQRQVLENYEYPRTVSMRSYKPTTKGNLQQIKRAAKAIEKSKKPLLYVGGGAQCQRAQDLLVELANKCQLPCTTTLLGLGAFPEDHPYALEMLGMHGTQYANYAMHETDCIIAVGSRFDDRVTGKLDEFAPAREEIIHIDIDPSSISKSIAVTIPVVGNCENILAKLIDVVEPCEHAEWLEQCMKWKKDNPLAYATDDGKVHPQFVISELYRLTGGDAIVTTEVGQHQMWAAHYWKYMTPRTFLSSGGLGTMGFGFPAAIGAKAIFPDRTVVNIAGDGSIQMNVQEMATAVLEDLPVKNIILNNSCLGMVRQWQEMFYERKYTGTDLHPKGPDTTYRPDFVKLAEAYGAVGFRASTIAEVAPTLEAVLACDKPVFAEFIVENEENVFPMIPAGASVTQMIGGMA